MHFGGYFVLFVVFQLFAFSLSSDSICKGEEVCEQLIASDSSGKFIDESIYDGDPHTCVCQDCYFDPSNVDYVCEPESCSECILNKDIKRVGAKEVHKRCDLELGTFIIKDIVEELRCIEGFGSNELYEMLFDVVFLFRDPYFDSENFKTFVLEKTRSIDASQNKDQCHLTSLRDEIMNCLEEYIHCYQLSDTEESNLLKRLERTIFRHSLSSSSSLSKSSESTISLEFASDEQKSDKLFVLKSVQSDGRSLQFATSQVRDDPLIVFSAIEHEPTALEYASENLRNDYALVRYAIEREGSTIRFTSSDLKRNEELITLSLRKDFHNFQYLELTDQLSLGQNKSFMTNIVEEFDGLAIQYAQENLKNDADFVLFCLRHSRHPWEVFTLLGSEILSKSTLLRRMKFLGGDLYRFYFTSDGLESEDVINNDQIDEGDDWEDYVYNELAKDFTSFLREKSKEESLESRMTQFPEPTQHDPKYYEEEERRIEEFRNDFLTMKSHNSEEESETFSFSDIDNLYSFLGRGGFGCVYLCSLKHRKNEIFVCKFLLPKLFPGGNPQMAHHVNEDGEMITRMSHIMEKEGVLLPYHKNLVPILFSQGDVSIDTTRLPDFESNWKDMKELSFYHSQQKQNRNENKSPYTYTTGVIIMDFYQMTLSDLLHTRAGQKAPLSTFEIASIMKQVLEGSKFMHDRMLVHLDLKKSNIFLDSRTGRAWIGDFGAMLNVSSQPSSSSESSPWKSSYWYYSRISLDQLEKQEGKTYDYIAPEIIKPKLSFGLDDLYPNLECNYEKADAYTIGMIGWQLLQKGEFYVSMKKDENEEEMERRSVLQKLFKENMMRFDVKKRLGVGEALKEVEEFLETYF